MQRATLGEVFKCVGVGTITPPVLVISPTVPMPPVPVSPVPVLGAAAGHQRANTAHGHASTTAAAHVTAGAAGETANASRGHMVVARHVRLHINACNIGDYVRA